MLANATEAVEALRHKRSGEILPTKNVARNTKLIYYADELVGLKFHNTVIARYTPNGVTIDTRDDWSNVLDHGWFTVTTWERINEFTRARNFTRGGLRFIDNAAGDGALLYTHGTKLDEQGRVIDTPLTPEANDAIQYAVFSLPQKIRRHTDKVMERWIAWDQPLTCCQQRTGGAHYLDHVEHNEYVIPVKLDQIAGNLRSARMWGDRLRDELAKRLREELRNELVPAAVKKAAPGFPYPQLTRRQA